MGLMAIILTLSCSSKNDTDLVREVIDEGVALAEAHQIGDLLRLTTKEFIALPGRHNQPSTKRVLFAAFRHYGEFKINYPRPSVEIQSNRQQATATVYFLIVSKSRQLPGLKALYNDPRQWLEAAAEKADLYQLKLAFAKQGGDWRVSKATLEGFKGVGF